MKKTSFACLAVIAAIPFALPSQARAQTDFSKFSLSRAAPADAFITVASRHNPERDFLNAYWKDVTKAFWDSGIATDMWDLMTDEVPDDELAEVEEIKERFTKLCGKVDWGKLFEKEFVYSGRFASFGPSGPPMYEGMVAGRMNDTETAAKNYEALYSILTEISKLIEAKAGEPVLIVTTESRKDGLTLAKASFAEAHIEFNIATKKDVVIITFGSPNMLNDALANLSKEKEAKRLVDTSRFNAAFSKLPPAEDTIVFFDYERMMSTFRGFMATLEKMGGPAAATQPANEKAGPAMVGRIGGQLLSDASIIDYMATVEWTEGHRVFTQTRTTVRDGGKSSPLFDIFGGERSVDKFAKYVPRESTSFSVSAGFDIAGLYDYIVNFMEKNVPGGKDAIAQWNNMQQNELHLDIRKDVLGLLEGRSYSVSLGNASVNMTRLTDQKKAEAQIKRLIDFVKANVPQEQGLTFVPVKVGPESEVYQISHPMLMMQGFTPVFGCADGYFIFATSADAVKKCLQTGRDKHASIRESGPWKEQALMPDGPVTNISFTNQTNMAQELQQTISSISLGLGLLQMGAGNMPPTARKYITAAARSIPKLLPVAEKMNFFKSKASYTTFENNAWTTHAVQNYKSPAEVKKLNEPSEGL